MKNLSNTESNLLKQRVIDALQSGLNRKLTTDEIEMINDFESIDRLCFSINADSDKFSVITAGSYIQTAKSVSDGKTRKRLCNRPLVVQDFE